LRDRKERGICMYDEMDGGMDYEAYEEINGYPFFSSTTILDH
jgi:hypothetical protein